MTGAFVSHVAHRDPAWSLAVTLTLASAAITLASAALRPRGRRLAAPVRGAGLAPP